jgi:hypothetical protein
MDEYAHERKTPSQPKGGTLKDELAPEPQTVPAFPPVIIKDGIAVFPFRSANGYVHPIRVPAAALDFLKRCWPFELSGSRGKKRLTKNDIDLCEAWMKISANDLDIHTHAHKGWLDWSTVTYTKDDAKARQQTFEDETNFNRCLLTAENSDELCMAYNGLQQTPDPADYPSDPAFCTAYDVARIFADAQKMNARPGRTVGLKHKSRGFGADSVDRRTLSKIPRVE